MKKTLTFRTFQLQQLQVSVSLWSVKILFRTECVEIHETFVYLVNTSSPHSLLLTIGTMTEVTDNSTESFHGKDFTSNPIKKIYPDDEIEEKVSLFMDDSVTGSKH